MYTEYFAEGSQPTDYCDHHIRANICNQSGCIVGSYCPSESYQSGVYIIGGTEGTEDTNLLTDAFLANPCTYHNASNSTYQGNYTAPVVPGVSTDPYTWSDPGIDQTVTPPTDPAQSVQPPADPLPEDGGT